MSNPTSDSVLSARQRSPSPPRGPDNANNNNNASNANNNRNGRRTTSPLANLARRVIAGLNHADNLINGRNDSPVSRRPSTHPT